MVKPLTHSQAGRAVDKPRLAPFLCLNSDTLAFHPLDDKPAAQYDMLFPVDRLIAFTRYFEHKIHLDR